MNVVVGPGPEAHIGHVDGRAFGGIPVLTDDRVGDLGVLFPSLVDVVLLFELGGFSGRAASLLIVVVLDHGVAKGVVVVVWSCGPGGVSLGWLEVPSVLLFTMKP